MELCLSEALDELQPQLMEKLSPPSTYWDRLIAVAPENDLKTVHQTEERDGGDAAISVLLRLLPSWGAEGIGWLVEILHGLGLHEAVRKIESNSNCSDNSVNVERTRSGDSLSLTVRQRQPRRSVGDWSTPHNAPGKTHSQLPRSYSEPTGLARSMLMRRTSLGSRIGHRSLTPGTMSDLPHEFLLPLITMLNSESPSDWRDLAKRFGIVEVEIDKMDQEGARASALVKRLINQSITMQELGVQIMDMERQDILSLLEKAGYRGSVEASSLQRIPGSPSVFRKHPASLSGTSIPENAVFPSLGTSSPLVRRRKMMLGSELTKMDINTNSELAQQGSSQLSCGGPRSPVTCFPRRVASDPFLNDPISPSGRPKIRHICNADVQKLALVIGNSQYDMPGWIRRSSVSEARSFAAQLREMKWTVTLIENSSLGQLRRAILAFINRCQRESVVFSVVFYAGHIITTNSASYLVHVDLPLVPSSAYVSHCLVPLQQLLEQLSGCTVTFVMISCGTSELIPVDCNGVSLLSGDVIVPNLASQTCVIVSPSSSEPGSESRHFTNQWIRHWRNHQDASLSSILEHVSLMDVRFCSIYPDPRPLISESKTLKRALVISPAADTDDLLHHLQKELWQAQSCTSGSESVTALHTFLFNESTKLQQRTITLVILMGHLAVLDHKPILFVKMSSSPSTVRSTISGELPPATFPLLMVADLMAEAVNGPKLLIVNNCSLSMEADEKLCSQLIPPRINMVVSFSRSRNNNFISRFCDAWMDLDTGSLLDVFLRIAPDTTASCLFTV